MDDHHPDTIDLVDPPTPPSPPIPLDIPVPEHNPPAVVMAEAEDPMAAFKKAIVDAFQEANRNSTYPMPAFAGKKGEKPEDHTLRFEDYVQHYDIVPARQSQAFVKTLTGKARAWADTTKDGVALPVYQAVDSTVRADVEKSLKHLFLTRFAVQGRTPEALYAEWQNLSYDPAKDDIEDFVRDVKKLAEQLRYGDTAALMAVRGALPLDLQNLTVNMNDLETVKKLLIKIFDNPKMKQNYAKKEPTPSTPAAGAFSQTTVIGEPHDKGMSYFLFRIDELGSKVDRLKIRDQKARKPPYKPQMTPKRGRGGGRRQTNNYSRGRGDRDDYRPRQNSRFRGKPRNQGASGRGRGRFDKSPNVSRPRVAGRTPNKDDKRCFYCQEIGHFVDRCYKKARDRRAAAEKAELRLLLDPTNGQETLPIPDPETDSGYDDSENEYPDQLNI